MKKKIIVSSSIIAVFIIGIFLRIHMARAEEATATSQDSSLLRNNEFQFHLINGSDTVNGNVTIILPSTKNHNGMIQIFHYIAPRGTAPFSTEVKAASGDEIEGVPGSVGTITISGPDLFLVADTKNHEWWVIKP